MKTTQLNVTVGVKIAVGYGGGVRYEITEMCDLDPDADRDQVLKQKRIELTKHVYDHAIQMRNRLDKDEQAREKK